jgi:hypothetical protein
MLGITIKPILLTVLSVFGLRKGFIFYKNIFIAMNIFIFVLLPIANFFHHCLVLFT